MVEEVEEAEDRSLNTAEGKESRARGPKETKERDHLFRTGSKQRGCSTERMRPSECGSRHFGLYVSVVSAHMYEPMC